MIQLHIWSRHPTNQCRTGSKQLKHQPQQRASHRSHCHHVRGLWMDLSHGHGLDHDLVTNCKRLTEGSCYAYNRLHDEREVAHLGLEQEQVPHHNSHHPVGNQAGHCSRLSCHGPWNLSLFRGDIHYPCTQGHDHPPPNCHQHNHCIHFLKHNNIYVRNCRSNMLSDEMNSEAISLTTTASSPSPASPTASTTTAPPPATRWVCIYNFN